MKNLKPLLAGLIGGVIGGALTVVLMKAPSNSATGGFPVGATGQPGAPIAQGGAISSQLTNCEDELRLYCAFVLPGAGRFKRCLEEHASTLSAACQDVLKNLKISPDGH